MDNLLTLRHRYEFWKRRYETTRAQKDLLQMQVRLKDYMQFIETMKVPRQDIFHLNESYVSCFPVNSENIIKIPPVVPPETEEEVYADNLSLLIRYLDENRGWFLAKEIAKAVQLSPSYVRQLLEQLQEKGLVEKSRDKSKRVFWKRSVSS